MSAAPSTQRTPPVREAAADEQESPRRAVGAMTDAAKDVNHHLKKIRYQDGETRFLRQLEDLTFSRAGWHVQWGHTQPGSWSWFDLADWVRDLEMTKSRVCHIRQRLEADGVIWYEAMTERPGIGRIGWNLNFSAWRPLQPGYATWGGARAGAGRPRKAGREQPSIDGMNPKYQAGIDDLNNGQAAVVHLNTKMLSSAQHSAASDVFKCATLDCSEAGQEAARADPLIIFDTEEDQREMDANASTAPAIAAQGADETPTPLSTTGGGKKRKPRLLPGEREYRGNLVSEVQKARDGEPAPKPGEEWNWAGWYFKQPGGPAPVEIVVACYTAERRRPRWDGRFLSLYDLTHVYGAYVRNPHDFIASIERSRKGANGEYDTHRTAAPGVNGHARITPAAPRTVRTVASASPYLTEGPFVRPQKQQSQQKG